ncbi:MAG: thioredoxin [Acutalibacteraceae bacterium]
MTQRNCKETKCDFVTEIILKTGYTKDTENRKEMIHMSILSVNSDNFNSVKSSDKTVLLDFYADWCGPCRMVSPLVDEIAEENPQYLVGKINVDNEPALAQAFGVASIPTLVVMKNGKVVNQSVGAKPKSQILAMLEG